MVTRANCHLPLSSYTRVCKTTSCRVPIVAIPTPILFLDSSTVALHTVDLQLKVIFIHLLAGHQFIICVHQVDLPFPRALTQLSSEP